MPLTTTSNYATVRTTLAVDVANAGTFTVPYPTGTVQADYQGANAGNTSDNMVVFDPSGDKYVGAQVGFAYGASNVTVTNNSGVTFAAGRTAVVGLPRIDPIQRYNGPKAIS